MYVHQPEMNNDRRKPAGKETTARPPKYRDVNVLHPSRFQFAQSHILALACQLSQAEKVCHIAVRSLLVHPKYRGFTLYRSSQISRAFCDFKWCRRPPLFSRIRTRGKKDGRKLKSKPGSKSMKHREEDLVMKKKQLL